MRRSGRIFLQVPLAGLLTPPTYPLTNYLGSNSVTARLPTTSLCSPPNSRESPSFLKQLPQTLYDDGGILLASNISLPSLSPLER